MAHRDLTALVVELTGFYPAKARLSSADVYENPDETGWNIFVHEATAFLFYRDHLNGRKHYFEPGDRPPTPEHIQQAFKRVQARAGRAVGASLNWRLNMSPLQRLQTAIAAYDAAPCSSTLADMLAACRDITHSDEAMDSVLMRACAYLRSVKPPVAAPRPRTARYRRSTPPPSPTMTASQPEGT